MTQWATLSPVTVGWMRQFRYFSRLYDKIRNVPGDVVECGLGEGGSFAMLAYLVGSENSPPSRMLWGYDSFAGWPEPSSYDESPCQPKKGQWAVPEQHMRKWLDGSMINKEFPELQLYIIPGFFEETLPAFPDRPIAFLHIDADLYSSYHDALTYLFPKVTHGGIVLFDEYKEFPPDYNGVEKWPGATKAIDDYFASLSYRLQHYEETKKYYVIKQ
jgi:O-methyltransferase